MCSTKITKGAPPIMEFMDRFQDKEEAYKYLIRHIYPNDEIVCPHCGCSNQDIMYHYTKTRTLSSYRCGHCRKGIQIFNGTVFEGLQSFYRDWLYTIYSMFTSRKSVSTFQLSRELHHKPDTMFRLRRRLQLAMMNYDLEPFSDIVQIDEMYCGYKEHNFYDRDTQQARTDKYPVFGIYDQVRNKVYSYEALKNEKGQRLTSTQTKAFIERTCKPGSTIVSDEWRGYNWMNNKDSGYHHEVVNHKQKQYMNENGFTTNGIEGYWGIVKKMYYATHASMSPQWLHLYLAEADHRRNYQSFEESVDVLLKQIVLFPQVIDIRKMGQHGNRTYNLKDYRIILPKCLDDRDIESITPEEIIKCSEPVYGILRTPYLTRKQRGYKEKDYPEDWQAMGMVENGVGYKDYRDKVINTLDDVSDMLKDATKYKEVNNYVRAPKRVTKRNCKTDEYRRYNRNHKMKWRFNQLPDILQLQIKAEYPNIMETTSKDKVHEIKMRMWELRRWYEKNKEFIEGVNY